MDGDTPETYIFLLNRDQEIVNLIEKAMPGINTTNNLDFFESVPIEYRKTRQQSSVDLLLDILNNYYYKGAVVNKADIFSNHEQLNNLATRRKSSIWHDPVIKQMEADAKIKIGHKEVEFL